MLYGPVRWPVLDMPGLAKPPEKRKVGGATPPLTTHLEQAKPGGTFTVRAKISPGDYAWIEIEDNGGTGSTPQRSAPGARAARAGHPPGAPV